MNNKIIILNILDSWKDKTIEGSTLFQKIMYFIEKFAEKQFTPKPFDFGYISYYYGPYSKTLTNELDSLIYYSVIDENTSYLANNLIQYYFKLNNDKGKKVLDKYNNEIEEKDKNIIQIVKQKTLLINDSYKDLKQIANASKIHFILTNDKNQISNLSDVISLAKRKNWVINADDIKYAWDFIEKIGIF